MTLKEIFKKLQEWLETHDYEEDYEEFDELCNRIMKNNQTYFQWSVDSDTFRLTSAFASVMECLADEGKLIKDYYINYLEDDRLFLMIEYK